MVKIRKTQASKASECFHIFSFVMFFKGVFVFFSQLYFVFPFFLEDEQGPSALFSSPAFICLQDVMEVPPATIISSVGWDGDLASLL